MLKVGLTGSIATGKSTVLRAFAAHGIATFSSDDAVHELYEGEAVAAVEALFPGVAADGRIDRAALAVKVLESPQRLAALEAVVHPLVRRRIARFLADAEAAGANLAVVDIPLLYENGVDWGLDRVVVTVVAEPEQRRRAMARAGMSVEKLDAILARQMPQAEKRQRADYVIDTSGTLEDTQSAVTALLDTLLREQAPNRLPQG